MDRRFEGALGIFDSGVGGLTVVNALLKRYPDERVLYVADQAHVPYGGRPLDEVCLWSKHGSEQRPASTRAESPVPRYRWSTWNFARTGY